MTNQQLYLAVGIPIIFGVLNTGVVIAMLLYFVNRMEARMDRLDAKIDSKVDGLRSELGSKIDSQVNSLRAELGAKIDKLAADYTQFYAEQSRHDERLSALERQRPPQA